jgi:hypothetical protein
LISSFESSLIEDYKEVKISKLKIWLRQLCWAFNIFFNA